jgi:hypothetical protein
MQIAIIPADPTHPIEFREIADGDARTAELAGIVGGDPSPLNISSFAMHMYAHWNGNAEGLPRNHRATVLADWAEAVRSHDTVAGDVVLTGPKDPAGNDLPIMANHQWWLGRFDAELSEPVTDGN